jgi:hypothetical protein
MSDTDDECLSTVSSLKPEDLDFLAKSPSLEQCLKEEAIRISNIKVLENTPVKVKAVRHQSRFSNVYPSSSKRPIEPRMAKQMMKNLLQDDLTKFIFVKIYGESKLPSSIDRFSSKKSSLPTTPEVV